MTDKKTIRAMIRKKRKEISETYLHEASDAITKRLNALPSYRDAKVIYTYVGCKGEVATDRIIRNALVEGKKVAVPKVLGDVMEFYYIESLDELAPGCMDIPEPVPDEEKKAQEENAFMVLPGLAFSRDGGRVGFGGGYYDKYLAAHPNLVKTAVAFSWQILPEVPREENDIPVPVIVTEEETIYA